MTSKKPHFRPVLWIDIPISARKAFMRLCGYFPGDGLERGLEWWTTYAEPHKVYLRTREFRWFVAEEK